VSWVVVMRTWLTADRRTELESLDSLTVAFEGRDAVIYRLS